MPELFVNAPIQNKSFNPDTEVGRILTIYTARALNGPGVSAAHLWNNVLASEQGTLTRDEYLNRSQERLEAKYKSMLLGRLACESDTLTDTNEGFVAWAQNLTADAIERGSVKELAEDAHVCNGCGATISLASAPAQNICSVCGTSGVHIEQRTMLLSRFDDDARIHMLDSPAISASEAIRLTDRTFIISKPRIAGIDLDAFGQEGQVIDPKIAIGLLAIYAAELNGYDSVRVVAGRSSAFNNAAHLFSYLGDTTDAHPRFDISPIARAPIEHLHYLQSQAIVTPEKYQQIIEKVLPESLPYMSADMTPETLERLVFSHQYKRI